MNYLFLTAIMFLHPFAGKTRAQPESPAPADRVAVASRGTDGNHSTPQPASVPPSPSTPTPSISGM